MKSLSVSKVDLKKFLVEVLALPYTEDGSKILMAFPQSGGLPKLGQNCPTLLAAIAEIEGITKKKAVHLMVNKVPPGVMCPVHTDKVIADPNRYHLPLNATVHSFWWDEKGGVTVMENGNWYGPMPFSGNHTVGNYGSMERVHLIVDTEK